jgi:hypothetical protein
MHNNLLSNEELNKINQYADILLQNKMNSEKFKQKLYEIQLNKENDIKKVYGEIDTLEFEIAKLKQNVLDIIS